MHTCTYLLYFFFFNDTATTEIYTLSLHDALPISAIHGAAPTWVKIENVLHEFSHLPGVQEDTLDIMMNLRKVVFALHVRSEEHTSELQSLAYLVCRLLLEKKKSALARYSAICRSL